MGLNGAMLSAEEAERIRRRLDRVEAINIAVALCHRDSRDETHFSVDEVLRVAARVNAFLDTGKDEEAPAGMVQAAERFLLGDGPSHGA